MIDSSANELDTSREIADQLFKGQEENLKQIRDELDEKPNTFSSEHFKRKFKPNISLSDQSFEKQEE